MDYKCAIFDMDGTLLDSMYMWRSVTTNLLKSLGVKLTEDDENKLEQMTMKNAVAFLRETCNEFKDITDKEIMEFCQNYVIKAYESEIKCKPNAKKFVSILRERGVKTVVASLTEKNILPRALGAQNMLDDFDYIVSTEEVGKSKNSPDIYLRCADEFSLSVSECAVFEDSLYAAKTAKSAGFYVVGIFDKYSSGNIDEFSEVCDRVIYDWDELCCELL